MNFDQLLQLIKQTHAELQNRAERSVNTALVVRNWLFGWYIVEYEQNGADRAELYGQRLIDRLSKSLKDSGLRGISPTNLRKFRQFYSAYPDIQQALPATSSSASRDRNEIQQTVSVKSLSLSTEGFPLPEDAITLLAQRFTLGWSHYVILLTLDNTDERRFYEIEAERNQWSMRELERQMASSLYERLALSRDKEEIRKLAEQGQVVEKAADLIKNPFVLEFLGLEERPSYSEGDLESAIIDKLEAFLLELGKGFLFEARQKRFTFDADHLFVDLVFYNRLLRCYVLIDLKIGKLAHQDLGQMQMYVNYFDRHVKTADENPTIGILLCRTKNDAVVELTLPENANVFASQYQLYLPSKEELKGKLLAWTEQEEV